MSNSDSAEISIKLQSELKKSTTAHEAEAWANAFKSFMIALGIQRDLELKELHQAHPLVGCCK